jgi:nucleoside-diphosphate-sugar epimerase
MVAMMHEANRPKVYEVRESSWTDPELKSLSAYIVSKTRAEKALWEWADQNDWNDKITTVNPGFVLGPTLDAKMNTSTSVIKLIMEGAYPAVPPVDYLIVDVRDLAAIHLAAMTKDATNGRRLLAAGENASMLDIANILRERYPQFQKKIPKALLPAWFVRLLAVFDRSLKSVTSNLGVRPFANSGYVSELTGVTLRPAKESITEAGKSILELGLVSV